MSKHAKGHSSSEHPSRKPLYWHGTSYDDFRAFPEAVQDDAGFQLDRVQQGLMPTHFSPEPRVGPSVYKIKVRERGEAYRVFYIAKFQEAVYVLHCYHKKSTRGKDDPKTELDKARKRYQEVAAERPAPPN